MCSKNKPYAPIRARKSKTKKIQDIGETVAADMLSARLRQMYQSLTLEPIPDSLLALLDKMKS